MKGAIIGDIIGSTFKEIDFDDTDFQLFKPDSAYTDDTILTIATADSILNNKDYEQTLKDWVRAFPKAGYRPRFLEWALSDHSTPYISKGEGAARRISPIGFAAQSVKEALNEAEKSTRITHNIPERINAAKAVAATIYMCKHAGTKKEIKTFIGQAFDYDFSLKVEDWKQRKITPESDTSPVQPALAAFMEASDYEEAIRLAIVIGGPTNTIASITGALAEAYFKHIPKSIIKRALSRITPEMQNILSAFEEKYMNYSEQQA
ncbi:ADP-ribosylglycohydrolase family protein [Marinilabilia sp.]|uniref:ADP-ribosylglycohydrolase family protein n=1 Tax=Marinilabilia sp. TaxID=2021252 RepID=UPI0025C31ADE|nr:ADP-ribosylglycohydrolase family protein [Marinilabilia sp.]